MLPGRVPFTGKSAIAVLRQQVEIDPPPLAERRAELPAEICAAVHRVLAKKAAERHVSAAELAADLVRAGQTPELVELAAAGLPATARTIVEPMSVSGSPGMPTAPTLQAATPAVSGRRRLWVILGASGLGLLLLLIAIAAGRRGNGNGNGGEVNPAPVVEPGMTGELVTAEGKRFRVRVLEIEGVLGKVRVLPQGGGDGGPEIYIDLRKFKGFQADPLPRPAPSPAPAAK
jgi:hypothetical protein